MSMDHCRARWALPTLLRSAALPSIVALCAAIASCNQAVPPHGPLHESRDDDEKAARGAGADGWVPVEEATLEAGIRGSRDESHEMAEGVENERTSRPTETDAAIEAIESSSEDVASRGARAPVTQIARSPDGTSRPDNAVDATAAATTSAAGSAESDPRTLVSVAEDAAALDDNAADRDEALAASEESVSPGKVKAAALDTVVPPGAEHAVKAFPMIRDEWRMWGGNPGRNMVNPFAKGVPTDWDIRKGKERNVRWKATLGSQSYGNPIIAEGKILVGTNNNLHRNPEIKGDKGVVMCFDLADGRFLWQAVHDKLASGRVNDWPEQGICASPVIENGRAYYVTNRCELVCIDLDGFADGNDGPITDEKYHSPIDGDIIWSYDMIETDGVFPHNLAVCSPLLIRDLVYVVTGNGVEKDHITIPAPTSPSFMAFKKDSGELVWDSAAPGENILHGQWSNPTYGVAGGAPQVVFPGGDGWLRSFEPLTGELLWKFDCNPKDSVWKLGGLGTRNNIIATPVFYDDSVYVAVGQDPEHGEGVGHFYRVRADGTGDVTGAKQVWHVGGDDFHRTIATAAVHEGLVYAADLSGFLYCFDQETGKEYWKHDLLAAVWGSPTVIDGKVFIGDEDGDILICKTGKTFSKINEINMDNSVYSTPIAIGRTLYIANRTNLFAIEESR
jgi:outer membrane protein assembly factor BamB